MTEPENADLRSLIRDLAMRRESHDRRQLYWALIRATVWSPVRLEAVPSDIAPADLQPLDREALGGLASFGIFTHQQAAERWQDEEKPDVPLRLERISVVDFLPIVLDAGAGSLYLNPGAKFTGELYRHELETCLEGARKLIRRERLIEKAAQQQQSAAPEPQPSSFWSRVKAWLQ